MDGIRTILFDIWIFVFPFVSKFRKDGNCIFQNFRWILEIHSDVIQIAKSVYSGFTASVGADSMPAATVAFVPCSIKMNEPVK